MNSDYRITIGDMRELGRSIGDSTIDAIYTDPPYTDVSAYRALAALARRVLKPGGWCLAYCGIVWLPDVLRVMAEHLEYGWIFAVQHTGGDLRFRKYRLYNGWKPIVGFYKPPLDVWWPWFKDTASGGREKGLHPWQQAVGEALHFLQTFCPPQGVVLDPFCGSGTTLVAARRLGLRVVGIERDAKTAEVAMARLEAEGPAQAEAPKGGAL